MLKLRRINVKSEQKEEEKFCLDDNKEHYSLLIES